MWKDVLVDCVCGEPVSRGTSCEKRPSAPLDTYAGLEANLLRSDRDDSYTLTMPNLHYLINDPLFYPPRTPCRAWPRTRTYPNLCVGIRPDRL
jgi:hypothetical protein